MVTDLKIWNFAFVPLSDEATGEEGDLGDEEDLDGFETEKAGGEESEDEGGTGLGAE